MEQLSCQTQQSSTTLLSYGKTVIPNVGKTEITVSTGNHKQALTFEVGLQACADLDLVKRVDSLPSILEEVPEVFEGLGCLKDEHNIKVEKTVTPVVHATRQVPLNIMEKVKKELDSIEKSKILSKTENPSKWVSSMIVVEKKK